VNSRGAIFGAGFLILYGAYFVRQGIRSRKTSDIALGAVCLFGGGALVVIMILGGRSR